MNLFRCQGHQADYAVTDNAPYTGRERQNFLKISLLNLVRPLVFADFLRSFIHYSLYKLKTSLQNLFNSSLTSPDCTCRQAPLKLCITAL